VIGLVKSESVQFTEGDGGTGRRTWLEGQFGVFVDESERLSDRRRYAHLQTDVLCEKVPDLVAGLRGNLPACFPKDDEEDLFLQWPRGMCPAALTLSVAGKGGRSQLSCDGLKATQWCLCLTGHMRMKLFPDDRSRLSALNWTEMPFGIFDEKDEPVFQVCSRAESSLDLFAAEHANHDPITRFDAYEVDLERWPDARELPRAIEVLLTPGNMVVVPGSWWVQKYFDEASWCVESQYLNVQNLDRVLRHVLRHNHIEAVSALGAQPAVRVDAVLEQILAKGCGGNGRAMLAKLRELDQRGNAGVGRGVKTGIVCEVCGRPATTKCGRCKALWLCGVECQRKSWPNHRLTCIRAR